MISRIVGIEVLIMVKLYDMEIDLKSGGEENKQVALAGT
jgi:hypothetical protein